MAAIYDKFLGKMREQDSSSSINECILNIRIPEDEDADTLTMYLELSSSISFDNTIEIDSNTHASAMVLAYNGEFAQLTSIGVPAYAYGGVLIVDLAQLGVDASQAYYARCRWSDGSSYSVWNSIRFSGFGIIEIPQSNITSI